MTEGEERPRREELRRAERERGGTGRNEWKRAETGSKPIRNRSLLRGSSAVSALAVHVCDERAPSRRQTPGNRTAQTGAAYSTTAAEGSEKCAASRRAKISPAPGPPRTPGYGLAARRRSAPGRRSRKPTPRRRSGPVPE